VRRKKLNIVQSEPEPIIHREYVKPKTDNQRDCFKAINEHKLVFILGVAGTGKTHCAVGLELTEVLPYINIMI
jgi:phosphate starvation-inducible protein PhoH